MLQANAHDIKVNDERLIITFTDQNQARISTCTELIQLRKAGEQVESIDNSFSDPDYKVAEALLIDCFIKGYAVEHNLILQPIAEPISISDVIAHFPATEALVVNEDEKEKIKTHFAGKTIKDYSPDLQVDVSTNIGAYTSKSEDSGYVLLDNKSYSSPLGGQVKFVTIASYVLHGSYSIRRVYKIIDDQKPLWDVEEITVNSPL